MRTKNRKATSNLRITLPASLLSVMMTLSHASSPLNAKALLGDGDGRFFDSEYESRAALSADAMATNIQAMEEGAVLLKNTLAGGGAPLAAGDKVTVFGKNSRNPIYSGTGSSGGTSNPVNIYTALQAAGIEYNPTMYDFYGNTTLSGAGRAANPGMGVNLAGLPIGETRATGALNYGGLLWNGVSTPSTDDLSYDPLNATPGYSNYMPVRESYDTYDDAAILMFSRTGGEGFDMPRTMKMSGVTGTQYPAGTSIANMNSDAAFSGTTIVPGARSMDSHYFQLDLNETNAIKEAAANFDKVIVLINSASPIELGFLDDPTHYAYSDKISAAYWIGTPGSNGFYGVGNLLTGAANPSGSLVDTYQRNFMNDPTMLNFGNGDIAGGNRYTVGGVASAIRFVDYQEGIYLGYRYYETKYEEMVKAKAANPEAPDPDAWYQANVVKPFGFGLSYTSFSMAVSATRLDGVAVGESALTLTPASKFSIDVTVTNTGSKAGKKTVQIFSQAPYTSGGIEKSSKVLVGFSKTGMLQPAESQVVTIEVPAYYMASYDAFDKNVNTIKGYELEAGAYKLFVAESAHDSSRPVAFSIASNVHFANDTDTNAPVSNLFESQNTYMTTNSAILSRATNFSNQSTLSHMTTRREKTQAFIDQFITARTTVNSAETATASLTRYFDTTGTPLISESYPHTHPTTTLTYNETVVKFADMFGLEKNDPLWDTLLNQLTFAQMAQIVGSGNYYNLEMDTIGKLRVPDLDGPVGWTGGSTSNSVSQPLLKMVSTTIVAASFNRELAHKIGKIIGEEGLYGYDLMSGSGGNGTVTAGWYAPAMNIHRTPFSGRNFEYFSEDGVISGIIAGEIVKGTQEKGIYSYIKHFFLNDQETDRMGVATWVDEQAMREIYAKPFEIAVKEANKAAEAAGKNPSLAVMSAFNRIGVPWAGASYAAMTGLLRNEWGFENHVITDYFLGGYMVQDLAIIAGNDKMLGNGIPYTSAEVLNEPTYGNTYKWMLRRAAKNILFTVANSAAIEDHYMVKASNVNLTSNNNNLDGVGKTFIVGTPVTYSLRNDVAAAYVPNVFIGDRLEAEYTYSLAPGQKLPVGLALRPDGTIIGTPLAITRNTSGASSTVSVAIIIDAVGEGSGLTDGEVIDYDFGRQYVTLRVNAPAAATDPFVYSGSLLGTAPFDTASTFSVATATGGLASEFFDVQYSALTPLPAGLSLSYSGALTGTVTGTDAYTASITVEAKKFAMTDITINGVTYAAGSYVESAITTFYINMGSAPQDGEDGVDGIAPHIGENGNWWIGEVDTLIKAQGAAGVDGEDGQDGINGVDGEDGVDGVTPHIGENGNWFIGDVDTLIKAQGPAGSDGADGEDGLPGEDGTDGTNGADGEDGVDGVTPHIGSNGNWFVGDVDTGIKAQGPVGPQGPEGPEGPAPEITGGCAPTAAGGANGLGLIVGLFAAFFIFKKGLFR